MFRSIRNLRHVTRGIVIPLAIAMLLGLALSATAAANASSLPRPGARAAGAFLRFHKKPFQDPPNRRFQPMVLPPLRAGRSVAEPWRQRAIREPCGFTRTTYPVRSLATTTKPCSRRIRTILIALIF